MKMTELTDSTKAKVANFVIENNILKGAVEPVNDKHKIGQLILDSLNEDSHHVAQVDAETGQKTTFAEMKDRSIRCALWLKKLGIGPYDIVVACTHNHLDSYVPLFATFFVDAIFSAWSHDTSRRFIKQFTPKVIFTCEKAADVLLEAAKLENLNVKLVVFGNHSNLPSLVEIMDYQTKVEVDNFEIVNIKSPKDVAYVLMTSGSSGDPKAAMRSHTAVLSANFLKQTSFDSWALKILWYSTLDWVTGILYVLTAIIKKQTRIVPSFCETEHLFQTIEKYQVDQLCLSNALMPFLASSDMAKKYNLNSVNRIYLTGNKNNKWIRESLHKNFPIASITNIYGATEIGGICRSTPDRKHTGTVGFINSNCQMKFVDLRTSEIVGSNQHGEIYVKSEAAMIGYYKNPEGTKKVFDEDGWYRTGDIGYYDESGEVFVTDRVDGVIKFRGHLILPSEIEEILLAHPDVQEAIVVALPHADDGNWPVALCKKSSKSNVTENELQELTSVLEDYKKLRGGIHFVENFQYTTIEKIARNEMSLLAAKLCRNKNDNS